MGWKFWYVSAVVLCASVILSGGFLVCAMHGPKGISEADKRGVQLPNKGTGIRNGRRNSTRADGVGLCTCIPMGMECPNATTDTDDDYTESDEGSMTDLPRRKGNSNRGRPQTVRPRKSGARPPVVGVLAKTTDRSTNLQFPAVKKAPSTRTRIVNQPLTEEQDCPPRQKQCCEYEEGEDQDERPEPNPGQEYPESPERCGIQRIIKVPNQPEMSYGQAEFGEYPWLAVILNSSNSQIGAGALISKNLVLTAAHKVSGFRRGGRMKVRLGEWNTRDDSEPYKMLEIEIENVVLHPGFNPENLQNDVAVVKLSKPVDIRPSRPHINTVCLPRQGMEFAGQECWVAGFGKDSFGAGNYPSYLKEVDLPIIDSNDCESRLRKTRLGPYFVLNRKSFLCAGGERGKDACTGDGGAPLVCRGRNRKWNLVGLVGFGIGCGQAGVPGVYVNVPNYFTWIYSKMNI